MTEAVDTFKGNEDVVQPEGPDLEQSKLQTIEVRWKFLYGEDQVHWDAENGRLLFPAIPKKTAGVYCLECWHDAAAHSVTDAEDQRVALYVGESGDIAHRFSKYGLASRAKPGEHASVSDIKKAAFFRSWLQQPSDPRVVVRLVLWAEGASEGQLLGYLPMTEQRVLRRLVEGAVLASPYATHSDVFDEHAVLNENPVAMKLAGESLFIPQSTT